MKRPRGRKPTGAGKEVRMLRGPESSGTPLHVQVYRRLRDNIVGGALKPGDRLPSARTLALDLRVSRNTVDAAFAQLRAEGLIVRRVGAGTVVAASIVETSPFVRRRGGRESMVPSRMPATASTPATLSERGALIAKLGAAAIADDRHASPCATDVRGFPSGTWIKLLAQRARAAGEVAFRSADPFGALELRDAIADQVRLTRGVQCSAHQVVVLNSTQQAIDLAARLLLDPGSHAALEDPGYTSARAALMAAGATVVPIPVDDEGLLVRELAAHTDVRLVYVTPSHQFPLGVTMSLERRNALLEWAFNNQAWIVEDDYDSEFRYADRPMPSLQGMDRGGRVLYVGTYNKVMFPGLRLAYIVVPESLVDAFGAARRISDGFSSPLLQGVLADFLRRGHYAAYVRAARNHYEMCRNALVDGITGSWGDRVTLGPSDTGLHMVAHFGAGTDDVSIAHAVQSRALGIGALSRYCHGPTLHRGLLLSYGAASPDEISQDLAALSPVIRPG
jgi:GntR family transcriptional regulator/MocR family aminotransferase